MTDQMSRAEINIILPQYPVSLVDHLNQDRCVWELDTGRKWLQKIGTGTDMVEFCQINCRSTAHTTPAYLSAGAQTGR